MWFFIPLTPVLLVYISLINNAYHLTLASTVGFFPFRIFEAESNVWEKAGQENQNSWKKGGARCFYSKRWGKKLQLLQNFLCWNHNFPDFFFYTFIFAYLKVKISWNKLLLDYLLENKREENKLSKWKREGNPLL